MRRIRWMAAVVLCLAVALAGCGKKDAGDVVKELNDTVGKLEGYKGSGRMVLETGQNPQEYQVEVWYKNPSFYRISLTNSEKDITQIVLRNNEGVFVLTPQLNKTFKFQSDWPTNQGQYYLYQSLVQSIVNDQERKYTVDGDDMIFDVQANYANATLARQKIWLDKKTYVPRHVEIRDGADNTVVTVHFNDFKFGGKFDKDSFDVARNMTGMKVIDHLPAMEQGKEGGKEAGADKDTGGNADSKETGADKDTDKADQANGKEPDKAADASKDSGNGAEGVKDADQAKETDQADGEDADAGKNSDETEKADPTNQDASDKAAETAKKDGAAKATGAAKGAKKDGGEMVIGELGLEFAEPSYTPDGVSLQDANDIKLGEDPAAMLRYTGTYNFSLVESRPEASVVTALPGHTINLGYTFGTLAGSEKKTLTWTYNGVLYRLSSADLPVSEMVRIAQSTQERSEK